MLLARIAVPVPALDLLTYLVPDSLETPPVGARVLVPLGSRQVTGLVVSVGEATRVEVARPEAPSAGEDDETPGSGLRTPDSVGLREIIDVIDDEPFLPAHVVELAVWLAEYYACGAGEAIAAAMPPFAWIESEQAVEITEQGVAVLKDAEADGRGVPVSGVGEPRLRLLRMLAPGRPVPIRLLRQRLSRLGMGAVPVHSLVRSLERAKQVRTTTSLRGRGAAFKTAKVAAITLAGLERGASKPGGPVGRRQAEALEMLRGSAEGLPLSTLRDRGVAADAVRRLADKGYVSIRTVRVERDPFAASGSALFTPAPDQPVGQTFTVAEPDQAVGRTFRSAEASEARPRDLTGEQAAALDRLSPLASKREFGVALLHGVTGSGKTEVYLRLSSDVLASGGRVLVLVPEIALTPALAALFRSAFGDRVAVQHSGLSDGERHDQWHRIRRGEIDVVIGTRSAVFAPLPDLALVVVDEEHDASYKQEESPRYHGRDVAIVRARREGALAVLGSATPSMETYQHALGDRYQRVVLARRVLDRPLASVRIVNMREEYAALGPGVIFSDALRAAIAERLTRQEQVLVLLNRRGFATAVFCRQCGNTIECPNCSVSLTVHGRERRRARCHYCNYSTLAPKMCPTCAAPYLEHVGVGTQRLEEEATRLFPGARIARLDRDVASRRGAMASLLWRFGGGEIDILIGTQMIAKGHDFPRVTLVGVISADVGLGLPDFRASERTFQLLTQVVGRAGRGEQPGEAIIQTLYPDHYSVRLACRQDYEAFFAEEIGFRRSMRYPPHVSLVNAVVRGATFQSAMEDAADLVRRVRSAAGGDFRVLGPAPAALVKLRGEHRAQFFVKGTRRAAMRQAVQAAVAARPDLRRRVTIDVDPLSVL